MTISEKERFDSQKIDKYNLKNNCNFLEWLKNSLDSGYELNATMQEMQDLIDKIANWYEVKYPERELERTEGIYTEEFKNVSDISGTMDFQQLLYRLTPVELNLIQANYRSKGSISIPYQDNNEVKTSDVAIITIKSINEEKYPEGRVPSFVFAVDPVTGNIKNTIEKERYLGYEDVNVDEALDIFDKKYKRELNYKELDKIVNNHKGDIELRHRLLQLVALKLLYSKNTTPERGHERAKKFIEEFNKNLGLTLSAQEIDEIINRDYTNGIGWEYVTRKLTDENGEEFDLTTVVMTNEMSNDPLSPKRKYELEKYLKGETEINDFTTKDLEYLRRANTIPFNKLLENLKISRRNNTTFDSTDVYYDLLDRLGCSEADLENRIRDVCSVLEYGEKNTKKLVHERNQMIKEMRRR